MNDTAAHAALLEAPPAAQTQVRLGLITASQNPELLAGHRQLLQAISMVGLEEGCVSRALCRCTDDELEVFAGWCEVYRLHAGSPAELEFWQALAWMATVHLAGRK